MPENTSPKPLFTVAKSIALEEPGITTDAIYLRVKDTYVGLNPTWMKKTICRARCEARKTLGHAAKDQQKIAFEAGWIAGAEKTSSVYNGTYRYVANLEEAWIEYLRSTEPLSNP